MESTSADNFIFLVILVHGLLLFNHDLARGSKIFQLFCL